jgi:hypothetical protein
LNGVTGTGSRRRYPAKVMRFARRLHEEGYRLFEIEAALKRQGYTPSMYTIRRWTHPEVVDYDRARRRRPPRRIVRSSGWFIKLARMKQLRDAGCSYASVTIVMNLDFGLSLTSDQVRYMLLGRTSKETMELLLVGERAKRGRSAKQ